MSGCMRIALDKIEQNENSRVVYKEGDLAELMASMKKHGLLQPVGVRALPGGRFDAVFGNRRILAAKKLGWEDIPVHVVDAQTDVDRDILNLIENIKRKNTTLAEDGRMFKLLMDRGLTESEVAARLDVTKERVHVALEVVTHVPVEYQKIMPNRDASSKRAGVISPTVTHELMNIRKSYGLNRKQFRTLLEKAKDGMTTGKAKQVAPLMRSGETLDSAIKIVEKMRFVALEIYIDASEAAKLEKKTGKTIRDLLTSELIAKSSAKTLTRVVATGARMRDKRALEKQIAS